MHHACTCQPIHVITYPTLANPFHLAIAPHTPPRNLHLPPCRTPAVVTCAFVLLRFGPGFAISGFLSLASAGLFAICCFAMGGYEVNLPIM